ncbi:uncharacterized protein LOC135490802 isoform X2 [Lineus longissimus]
MNTTKVKILNHPGARGSMTTVTAIIAGQTDLHQVYWSNTSERKMIKKDAYLLIHNGTINHQEKAIRLTPQSKIFSTTPFSTPEGLEDKFLHAPQLSLKDALTSPKKTRVTVEALVKQVSPLKTGANWKRKDVYLEEDGHTMTCKMWNESADTVKEDHINKKLKIENVEVDIYQGQVSLKNTSETSMVTHAPESKRMQIIAISNEEDTTPEVLGIIENQSDAQVFTATAQNLPHSNELPLTVKVVINGTQISDLEKITSPNTSTKKGKKAVKNSDSTRPATPQ